MQKILKRLEIIKSSIEIEDIELIEFQIAKLKKLNIDEEIKTFIDRLERLDYSVIIDIENYIRKYNSLVVYEDIEIKSLKLQLKALEQQLQTLISQRDEYLHDIEGFNQKYHIILGDIIEEIILTKEKILYYKNKVKIEKLKEAQKYQEDIQKSVEEIDEVLEELEETLKNIDENDELYEKIKETIKNLKSQKEKLNEQKQTYQQAEEEIKKDEEYQEYEETKEQYKEFHNEYEEAQKAEKNSKLLNKEDEKLLKKLWKKASRLCHPDIVADKLKGQATKIIQQLNDAYSKKDLEAVKNILANLENGIAFELNSDVVNDKKILKAKIQEMKQKIENLQEEIEDIQQNEIFQELSNIDNWDSYFEDLKKELIIELNNLSEKLNNIEYHNENKEEYDKEFWEEEF